MHEINATDLVSYYKFYLLINWTLFGIKFESKDTGSLNLTTTWSEKLENGSLLKHQQMVKVSFGFFIIFL